MHSFRRTSAVLGLVVAFSASLVACAPEPSLPPSTDLHHVTTWQSDITYADTLPEIVDWVGYGSFAYNEGLGGCNIVDGGAGWTESFTRITPQTVRVRLTLDWVERDNGVDGYGCGVNDVLNVGLLDGGGTEVAFELITLISHT